MRKLTARAGFDEQDMSDYTRHTAVVSSCVGRCEIAELIQRYFEKHNAAALQRFARARGGPAVLALWHEALRVGKDIAGALWAVWSHADVSEEGGGEIFADIHMLSHQTGAAVRAGGGRGCAGILAH